MMAFLRFTYLLIALFHYSAVLNAMEFRIYYQAEIKKNVVIAQGSITSGDDKKFLSIYKNADRDEKGHIILVLDSMGGSVKAAFALAKAMDKVKVYTIVPENAICASACASVVYVAGDRRMVLGNGTLGFHSCYTKNGSKLEESSFCNELIAQHAIGRGLSHASVNLFVDDYGAKDMAWIGQDVACMIGLCKP